jgi:peptidoglycan/LPS O-acetylase OafA/YrhL
MAPRPSEIRSPAEDLSFTYDLLRALGLFCILLAHSAPPQWLFHLRQFDVPLMVFVSGAVCALGESAASRSYLAYVGKRVIRLLAPAFVFLTGYFLLAAWLVPGRFDERTILRTFLLVDGIGYVWVLRVFLLVALLTHPLLWLKERCSDRVYLAVILGAYLLHEALWGAFAPIAGHHGVLHYTVFYAIPYGCIFALGLRWPSFSWARAAVWGVAGMLVWSVITLWAYRHGDRINMWAYKYPPHFNYLWYAMGACHLLLAFALRLRLPESFRAPVVFLSRASLWIYLWHILALNLAHELTGPVPVAWRWLATFLIVAVVSVGLTLLQKMFVSRLLAELSDRPRTRSWLRSALAV